VILDDARWSAIVEVARPYPPDERARPKLDWVLTNYPGQLRNADAIRMERERMRRMLPLIEALIPELVKYYTDLARGREINLHAPAADIVPTGQLLQALWAYEARVADRLAALEQLSFWYTRTSDPARDVWLYRGLCEIWTEHFGGPLGYSTRGGTQKGPLIRFLEETTKLVLDPPPSLRMLREGIQREVVLREQRAD
jgi:hypothetical protein